jgi:hypothetical protein
MVKVLYPDADGINMNQEEFQNNSRIFFSSTYTLSIYVAFLIALTLKVV